MRRVPAGLVNSLYTGGISVLTRATRPCYLDPPPLARQEKHTGGGSHVPAWRIALQDIPQPGKSLSGRELILAAFLIAFGGVVVALSFEITPGVQTDPLGPRFVPIALGLGIALCGVLLAAAELLYRGEPSVGGLLSDGSPEGEEDPGPFSPARFVGAICATALYIGGFVTLGFLLATPPYIAAILLIHGGVKTRALLITPFLVTIALYVTFRFGLLIPVPDGPLEGLLPW